MYIIEPQNEGQALNYKEKFGGSLELAKERAHYMIVKLQDVLVDAKISVRIYNKDYEQVVEVKLNDNMV
jgi:hypothetical protein